MPTKSLIGLVACAAALAIMVICVHQGFDLGWGFLNLAVAWAFIANWLGDRLKLCRMTARELKEAFRTGKTQLHGYAKSINQAADILFCAAALCFLHQLL